MLGFRVIVSYKLTFLTSISKVTENMRRAQARDAVLTQKLHFRSKLANCDTPPEANQGATSKVPSYETEEMTINEIINGKFQFVSLIFFNNFRQRQRISWSYPIDSSVFGWR